MQKKYTSKDFKQTQKLGEALAKKILKLDPQKRALVLGLQGNLGGGKTTFLQGFAKGLGIKEKILSPTFVIMKKFRMPALSGFKYFYHIDCYRTKSHKDIAQLGFKEIISNSKNIIAVEWSERVKKVLPKDSIVIKFKYIYPERSRRVAQSQREIAINFENGLLK